MFIYGLSFNFTQFRELDSSIGVNLVVAAILSAFVGAFMGSTLLKKITLKSVQFIVGILLAIVGLGMITGLL